MCFVETKNLDGETNLKQKQAHKDLAADFDDEAKVIFFNRSANYRKIAKARNEFKYEKPNDYLYKFVGKIILPPESKKYRLYPDICRHCCTLRAKLCLERL